MLVGALVVIVVSVAVSFILNKVVYGIVGNPYAISASDILQGIRQ
jgi:hypothetical protein